MTDPSPASESMDIMEWNIAIFSGYHDHGVNPIHYSNNFFSKQENTLKLYDMVLIFFSFYIYIIFMCHDVSFTHARLYKHKCI